MNLNSITIQQREAPTDLGYTSTDSAITDNVHVRQWFYDLFCVDVNYTVKNLTFSTYKPLDLPLQASRYTVLTDCMAKLTSLNLYDKAEHGRPLLSC